jgi:hypothetical protein
VIGGVEPTTDETTDVTVLAPWETAACVDAIAVGEDAEVELALVP